MKNVASYSEEGASIQNCQKINFVYGANGSGKSTISGFLSNQKEPRYKDCQIEWENNDTVDILVYNREFREKNFKENIAGVFTLGQDTIETKELIENLKQDLEKEKEKNSKYRTSLEKKEGEIQEHKKEFRDLVWNTIFKQCEPDIQLAFSGYRNSKELFLQEVKNHYNNLSCSSNDSKELLLSKAKILFSKTKLQKYNAIHISIDTFVSKIEEIENSYIWSKVIVGNKDLPIGKLIYVLNNADWVNQGRKFLQNGSTCPFCQNNTISDKFKEQLDSFFSGEYKQDVNCIKDYIDKYDCYTSEILQNISVIQNTLDNIADFKDDSEKLSSIKDSLNKSFTQNRANMLIKENEPSRHIDLDKTFQEIEKIKQLIIKCNRWIDNYNQIIDHHKSEKTLLITAIWNFILNINKQLISNEMKKEASLLKAKIGIQQSINKSDKEIHNIKDKLSEACKNLTSVQPTVDEINRSLKSYGFTNFKIVASPAQKNSYQIQRMDGSLVSNTLSEGEETFISFLYFLQFVKGSLDVSKVSSNKVLVLDDPICSLDSNVLYIVSSLIKGLIKDIRQKKSEVIQLFVLTHNVFFHKETSFIDQRTDVCNDIHYWIISKNNNISSIKAYERENPITTTYELLWQELKRNTNSSVAIQNTMRRILENYFRMFGKVKFDKIVESFDTQEERMICHSLLSWINDGSHSIPEDLYVDSYSDSIDRYKQIFKEIFNKMGHKAHYNMMMGLHD